MNCCCRCYSFIVCNTYHDKIWFTWFVVTQISTSVQQTTEVVTLMPAALTPWAAPRVPVYLDTLVTELPVQVNSRACNVCHKSGSIFSLFFLCLIQHTRIHRNTANYNNYRNIQPTTQKTQTAIDKNLLKNAEAITAELGRPLAVVKFARQINGNI